METPIFGEIAIRPAEMGWAKNIEEGKDGVELVDLDVEENR